MDGFEGGLAEYRTEPEVRCVGDNEELPVEVGKGEKDVFSDQGFDLK